MFSTGTLLSIGEKGAKILPCKAESFGRNLLYTATKTRKNPVKGVQIPRIVPHTTTIYTV